MLTALAGLMPSLLPIGLLLLGILLNLALILMDRPGPSLSSFTFLAGTGAVLALIAVSAVLVVGILGSRTHSGLLRFVLLFSANLVIVFIITWLFVRMVGGVSMAVVDGAVPPGELRRASLTAALPLVGLAQLVVVPWVIISVVIMERVHFKEKGTS